MRILVQATLLPGVDPTPHLAAEAARVEELMDDGSAEQFYLPADQTGAYLVINAPDLDTAHAVTQTLPMAKAGLLEFTYTELAPPSAAW
ncbi:MAG TPA: YciI family protein [Mycobacterium sp.]|nr:YciI family protein [Mycobacterium sp.]HUH69923.1 YciI family protein [Mycobacterium sp.]